MTGGKTMPRPVLKYPGSKWRLAEWIISLMPEKKSYLEPFFGSGAVFFKKPPSRIETINDLDGEITNLFRCIREKTEELVRAVELTPYSPRGIRAGLELAQSRQPGGGRRGGPVDTGSVLADAWKQRRDI